MASGNFGGGVLFVGVVGAADKGAGGYVLEAQIRADFRQFVELGGCVESIYGQVVFRGAEILADGEEVAVHGAEVSHGFDDVRHGFAHAYDDAGLGGYVGGDLLGAAKEFEGALVVAFGSNLGEDVADGFDVVIEDRGPGFEYASEGKFGAFEIWDKDFDAAVRQFFSYLTDAHGEDEGAAVGQVVAIDRGYDAVVEVHALYGPGEALGFGHVEALGSAGGDGAVAAGAGADVSENHEGGAAAFPAVADVGAAGLFADGVQV